MEPKKLLEIIEVLDQVIAVATRMKRKCWLLYVGGTKHD